MSALNVTNLEGVTTTVNATSGHSVMEIIRDAGFDELLALPQMPDWVYDD